MVEMLNRFIEILLLASISSVSTGKSSATVCIGEKGNGRIAYGYTYIDYTYSQLYCIIKKRRVLFGGG